MIDHNRFIMLADIVIDDIAAVGGKAEVADIVRRVTSTASVKATSAEVVESLEFLRRCGLIVETPGAK